MTGVGLVLLNVLTGRGRALGAEGGDYGNGVHWEEVSKEQRNALGSCKLQLRAETQVLSFSKDKTGLEKACGRMKTCPILLWYQWTITHSPTMTAWRELTVWTTETQGKMGTLDMETPSALMVSLTSVNHLYNTLMLCLFSKLLLNAVF